MSSTFYFCSGRYNLSSTTVYEDNKTPNTASIKLLKGKSFNHPTYVIWAESLEGEYLSTIYITKSYASGVFGHEMIDDSIWMPKPGQSFQPAALPYWTYKKGKIDGTQYIPTPEHPFVDAYTGATVQGDFEFRTNLKRERYKILLEVNQSWDWNKYWTNNKYANNDAYKHSAQPSLIYAVEINESDSVFYLNPIGHGDPRGESGKLFTNLSTLTTAKEIFQQLKIQF